MSKGRVLVIEDDEWVALLLAKFLREAGFEVVTAGEARQGFERAKELMPDCIVCDVVLPDIDGFWVARQVRSDTSALATTPFVFLTSLDDSKSRLQGLNVGADVYISKPFRHEEVIAQVTALIEMADRLRTERQSWIGGPPSGPGLPVFGGDLSQMALPTVLTLLEMERRSGRLKVARESQAALLHVHEGTLVSISIDDEPVPPRGQTRSQIVPRLNKLLRWSSGRFSFRHEAPSAAGRAGHAINNLLLDALRQLDEAAR